MKFKWLLFFLLLTTFSKTYSQTFSASNFTLISNIDPEPAFNSNGNKYSGCWGWYQSNTNKEYAIVGSQTGTYWIDVTNPASPVVCSFSLGTSTNAIYREIKTYQNYCYVFSDDMFAAGLQIFDMSNLPFSVTKVYESQSLLSRGHAAWVDGNKLYVSGVTYSVNSSSSMNIYSLANPASPVLLRELAQDMPFINYVHDMFVRNDTIYASCINQGLYVFKYNTSNNTISQLGSLTSYTASGVNHSSALTTNGQTLVFMDEYPAGLPIKVANVSNLSNIQVLATVNQFSLTTPHNPFVVNNQYCFASSYQDGLQLYDISNPAAPFLAGYFDTYPQGGGNTGNWGTNPYEGQWGCYPFLPSKTILALDMHNGAFLLKTNLYQNLPTQIKSSNAANSELNLFPNPVKNKLNLNLPAELVNKEFTLQVFNSEGKLVVSRTCSELNTESPIYKTIDVSDFGSGLYLLNLISKDNIRINKKFTVSN